MKKIVILGATSTMIQPLLRRMANDGMELLLVARSQERLDSVRSDLLARGAANVLTFETDLTSSPDIVYSFAEQCFRDFDTLLLSYGTMLDQDRCQTDAEYALGQVRTNFVSSIALSDTRVHRSAIRLHTGNGSCLRFEQFQNRFSRGFKSNLPLLQTIDRG